MSNEIAQRLPVETTMLVLHGDKFCIRLRHIDGGYEEDRIYPDRTERKSITPHQAVVFLLYAANEALDCAEQRDACACGNGVSLKTRQHFDPEMYPDEFHDDHPEPGDEEGIETPDSLPLEEWGERPPFDDGPDPLQEVLVVERGGHVMRLRYVGDGAYALDCVRAAGTLTGRLWDMPDYLAYRIWSSGLESTVPISREEAMDFLIDTYHEVRPEPDDDQNYECYADAVESALVAG